MSILQVLKSARKRRRAEKYLDAGKTQEAYKLYEELLLDSYQQANDALNALGIAALRENDRDHARCYQDKRRELARLFEMGAYHECTGLELAILEKDADAALPLIETMLKDTESIFGFYHAPLFAHMEFKDIDEQRYIDELRKDLIAGFQEEDFLRDDPRFQALIE